MDINNPLPLQTEDLVVTATIQAANTISEALSLAFENCAEQGRPLSAVQQSDITSMFMFVFREYELKLRQHAEFSFALSTAFDSLSEDEKQDLVDKMMVPPDETEDEIS